MVPSSALVYNADGLSVAIVQDGKVHFRKVAVARDFGNELEISEGLDRQRSHRVEPRRTPQGRPRSPGRLPARRPATGPGQIGRRAPVTDCSESRRPSSTATLRASHRRRPNDRHDRRPRGAAALLINRRGAMLTAHSASEQNGHFGFRVIRHLTRSWCACDPCRLALLDSTPGLANRRATMYPSRDIHVARSDRAAWRPWLQSRYDAVFARRYTSATTLCVCRDDSPACGCRHGNRLLQRPFPPQAGCQAGRSTAGWRRPPNDPRLARFSGLSGPSARGHAVNVVAL